MRFKPFPIQEEFLFDESRILAAFAGKRGGKTEIGAIRGIVKCRQHKGVPEIGVDPFAGAIIAPTMDMLRRLSLAKFLGYSKAFVKSYNKSTQTVTFDNGAVVYGLSADRPERVEGLKLNWIWLDEVWQMSEQIFLECLARVADTKGDIWMTGSLGVQYVNPKAHWAYKHLKESPIEGAKVYEWSTADNPYFPREELERLKNTLDPKTYRQMFEISYDVAATNAVYPDFEEANVKKCHYDPKLETSVVVDWGWAHPMACLFIQYDRIADEVRVIDEVVRSKMTLDQLWDEIKKRKYNISHYFCDIAGTQEREQQGISNIEWFRKKKNIHFKYRKMGVLKGISMVRSRILNGLGQRKLYIDPSCKHLIDEFANYRYPEKNGEILNENPVKKDDDAIDALRYYIINRLDPALKESTFMTKPRFGKDRGQWNGSDYTAVSATVHR